MVRRAAASWSIWQLPRIAIVLILAVDLSAVLLPFVTPERITLADTGTAAFLASLSITYSVLTCRWERARRALIEGKQPALCPNLLASWTFAAAVILPLPLAVGVTAVAAIAEWPARNITGQARPYRYIYSTASAILASGAAHLVGGLHAPFQTNLLLAVPTYMAVGSVCVVMAMVTVRQTTSVHAFMRPSTHRLEVLTIAIALAEVQLLHLHQSPMMWLSLPATIGLQRWAVRSDIRATSRTHIPPMREEAWLIAATEIVTALPVVAVMRVNTADPLAASAVAQMQAGCDAIGYAGKAGLAVLLVDCPDLNADALAARLRTALFHAGVEASVATAAKPRDGYSLDDLLAVCEAELIARDAASRSANPSRPEA